MGVGVNGSWPRVSTARSPAAACPVSLPNPCADTQTDLDFSARPQGVFEDDENVHIVQEYCSGGELHHAIGTRHYSERTVCGESSPGMGCQTFKRHLKLQHPGAWTSSSGYDGVQRVGARRGVQSMQPCRMHRRLHVMAAGGFLHACRAAHACAVPRAPHPASRHQARSVAHGCSVVAAGEPGRRELLGNVACRKGEEQRQCWEGLQQASSRAGG